MKITLFEFVYCVNGCRPLIAFRVLGSMRDSYVLLCPAVCRASEWISLGSTKTTWKINDLSSFALNLGIPMGFQFESIHFDADSFSPGCPAGLETIRMIESPMGNQSDLVLARSSAAGSGAMQHKANNGKPLKPFCHNKSFWKWRDATENVNWSALHPHTTHTHTHTQRSIHHLNQPDAVVAVTNTLARWMRRLSYSLIE